MENKCEFAHTAGDVTAITNESLRWPRLRRISRIRPGHSDYCGRCSNNPLRDRLGCFQVSKCISWRILARLCPEKKISGGKVVFNKSRQRGAKSRTSTYLVNFINRDVFL